LPPLSLELAVEVTAILEEWGFTPIEAPAYVFLEAVKLVKHATKVTSRYAPEP
jgi:hypothetical protein